MRFIRNSLHIITVSLIVLLSSCIEDYINLTDEKAAFYQVKIAIAYPSGINRSKSDISITVDDTQRGKTDTVKTDSLGIATLNLEIGTYNFSASFEDSLFAYNGNIENESIEDSCSLEMDFNAVSITGGLIFKEIYFTGASPASKYYFSDQFHEIYNNSDDTIYLDGVGIGILEPTSRTTNIWADTTLTNNYDRLPINFYTFYIPGNGTEHPLGPRTSIVIAQDGINHHSDSINGNPNSPVDLGDADWETYCGDINNGQDADAAGVPNLSLLYTSTTTLKDFLHPTSGAAIILFKLPDGTDYESWATSSSENLATKPQSTSTKQYLQIPVEYVIDAVEIVRMDKSQRYKRLPSDLDAGKVWCSDAYIGKSIRRKAKQIIDGRVIYKDTNNSTEDFVYNSEGNESYDIEPTPFENPTVVD